MALSRPASALRAFLATEAAGGYLLILAAALALIAANLPATADAYHHFVHAVTGPVLVPKLGPMTVHLWVNDGLMAIFFLLVGLEIKRELLDGQLARPADRVLPVIAAVAGMAAPAAIYLACAGPVAGLARGWAIPAATDIAFAIGVMALLGRRVPTSLKLFLTTVAIVDDMGAVAIIAAFYTESLDLGAAAAGLAVLGVMFALNRLGVRAVWPFLIGFAALWYAELVSGIHATVAGVLAALAVPIRVTPAAPDAEDSTLHRLEHALAPWVAFVIVPVFGFVNAGVALGAGTDVLAPLPLGIALGLFLGKQAGVFGAVWATVRLGLAPRPAGAGWVQIYGAALLCGIGFTMSLFIAGLAFPGDPARVDAAKIGVLAGSLLSALAGFAVLRLAARR
ncbi:Na+/H+ antiporter NhaA [Sphingomonas changnyeongensis]|uniref:Na(+)/H(+) antiporter NhaA n=1 Tax=Sphingomonas changnyeongensis TaxID=2698679 RepID=A0A7Z2NUC4_9SPHN|nr:Na+/H+ antiporter NhaA [Sphingomonas changnyeongensis]QHL89717.1 Na+/H+ antiporter NhaA [Sphingomonas changnyeongensis]